MIKEILDSFKDQFNTKTTNPFFGTLIGVWLIDNWRMIYGLFNFPNDYTLDKKYQFICEQYSVHGNWYHFNLICVALLILTISYALINFSRLIVNLYEKKVTPWVYEITDKGSVVLKDDYNKLKAEVKMLEKRLEEERESKSRLQIELDNAERKYSDLKNKNTNQAFGSNEIESADNLILIVDDLTKKYSFEQINGFFARIQSGDSVYQDLERDAVFDGLLLEFKKHDLIDEKKGFDDDYSVEYVNYFLTNKGQLFKNAFMSSQLRKSLQQNDVPSEIFGSLEILKDSGLSIEALKDIIIKILNKEYLFKRETGVVELLDHGFISLDQTDRYNDTRGLYELTKKGNLLHKIINEARLKNLN